MLAGTPDYMAAKLKKRKNAQKLKAKAAVRPRLRKSKEMVVEDSRRQINIETRHL